MRLPLNVPHVWSLACLALLLVMTSAAPAAAQPFAYIATTGNHWPSNTCYMGGCQYSLLHVINTATGHEVASIALAPHDVPTGVVVAPAAGRAFVSRYDEGGVTGHLEGQVSVVDLRTNTVGAAFDSGPVPTVRAVLPDGSSVFVTNMTGHESDATTVQLLRVISTATGAIQAFIPTEIGPAAVAVAPDGRRVYVANSGSSSVTVIDARSLAITSTIAVGAKPIGLAVSPDGARVYVANRDDDTVSVVDTARAVVVATIPVGPQPGSLAVTADSARVAVSSFARDASSPDRLVIIDTTRLAVAGTVTMSATRVGTAEDPLLAYVVELSGALSTVNVNSLQVVKRFAAVSGVAAFGPASGCVYEVSPELALSWPGGGTGRLDIPAPEGCAWSATQPPDWITWTSAASGTGPGTITYSVAPASTPRTAYVLVAGQQVKFMQVFPDMVVEAPVAGAFVVAPFRVAGWAINRDSQGSCGKTSCSSGVASVDFTVLRASGGDPVASGQLSYGASRPDVAALFGGGSFNPYANSGFSGVVSGLVAGTYTLKVTARSVWGSSLDQTRDVAITVVNTCGGVYTVSPDSLAVSAAGGPLNVTVTTSGVDCGWAATSDVPWITVSAPAGGLGTGSMTVVTAANTSGQPRTGTVSIAGKSLPVTQAGAPCSVVVSPSSVLVGPTADDTRSPSLTPFNRVFVTSALSDCSWTAMSSDPWLTISTPAGGQGLGPGPVEFAVSALVGSDRTGTLTIAGQTVTVRQSAQATFSLDHRTLNFGVAANARTGPQVVVVNAALPVKWNLTSYDAGEVEVSQWYGTGPGSFTVKLGPNVATTSDVPHLIGVFAPGAPSVAVNVRVNAVPSPEQAYGQVDTPVQNAAGIVGAIAVTGWALDDVGVAGVKIYRGCVAFEPPGNCQVVGGQNVVYVGDATFVDGARPDVETAFSNVPLAYRGGWGYLLLTNLLPHVPSQQMFGGQGPVTLYAFATDLDGHVTLLGRSQMDHTPTTIGLANDALAKPFGAIDTPQQGQTVSGRLVNFGWALTRDTDTTAGAADILVPLDGSTMGVYIDGVAVGTVGYNQCRGTIGNPAPTGVYCDDDVANTFGNRTPQASFTPRIANPTTFRNLDAGRAAIGAFSFDTTTIGNGLHTIAWGVTDSAGRSEGIGSRYFTVLNTMADANPPARAAARPGGNEARPARNAPAVSDDPATGAAVVVRADTAAQMRGEARTLADLAPASGEVWARTGFDVARGYDVLPADSDGVRRVQLAEFGRLELHFGPVDGGHLVANGALSALPPGSRLDPATGRFTWAPGVGYVGTYRLAFVRGDTQLLFDVTVR